MIAVGAGIAVGSGGVSLLLWGDPAPAAGARAADSHPAASGLSEAAPAQATPVRIDLPSIHVSVPLRDLHVQDDGTLQVPSDPGDAGWWSEGTTPGDPGAAIVVGHLDSLTGPAAFYRLPELRTGDKILIGRADRTSITFVVETKQQYSKDDFPRDLVYGATQEPTLRLITCGGAFDRRTGHYTDNVVVFARLADAAEPAEPAGPAGGGPVAPPARTVPRSSISPPSRLTALDQEAMPEP